MNEKERKEYLKYIDNYTINDLADIFNTQNFVIQDKDKFNEILLYYYFKNSDEIEKFHQEKDNLQNRIDNAVEYINADYINGKVDGLSWLEVRELLDILKESGE